MPSTAFQTIYRQEYIKGFEARESMLRKSTVTEANIKGNQAIFLVADSGSATAVTRGSDGLIPSRNDNQTQNTCALTEYHDLVTKTGFTIDASQGDQRKMMQETGMATMNRKIDDLIIAQLDAGSLDANATSQIASVALVNIALGILGQNDVDVTEEENMFAVVSHGFMAYLRQTKEFASRDYVDVSPYKDGSRKMLRWLGLNWIVSNRLTGKGTAAEKCYLYHKHSVGHAVDKENLETVLGVNDEHKYTFNRTSYVMGAKLLQNNGIIRINHDASAIAAS
jgi:hypothetical protein